ncbi:hypothetical protein PFLG_01931 [Plasmodium falciparum RAJ116]|uniref:Uncharacterized protein n=1 Tax=Plasmodium falciparum RAJ116 TaxID=580058 RepID=A0A0L0CWF4_PLAFA|nr:hypothetical protein PFLG_01931 [Plasmodium falciparum RAJ116]
MITHDTQKNVEENNCFHELDKKNIEKMNLFEQIIYGKHIIKKIFFLLDASEYNLISFIFTKLYNYLSLIPPKISPDDFLPLNEKCVDNKNVKADDNTVELNKSTNFIFEDLKFFLKKMDIFVKTFNINSLNSICESGFNSKSAFFLCFYMTPSIFANIFYYLNNNITAIVNESFNLEENIKYYEHVHVKKTEYTLEPYNIIDKTVFYFQIVVFYLIINTNNVLMDNSNYLENVCSFFSKCLKYEYVKKKKKNEENPQKLQLKGYSQWIFLIMNNNNNNNKRNY